MKSIKFFQMSLLRFGLLPFLPLIISACSGSQSWVSIPKYPVSEKSSLSAPISSYNWNAQVTEEIAPGYLIKIESPDAKVNGEYRIEFDKTLKLPYEVSINTAGLTEKQLTEEIRSAYKTYFRSPSVIQVSIAKKEYLLDVQGLVKKPGQYAVKQNASLDEVIAKAEGLSESSNKDQVPRYVRITSESGDTGLIRLADYHSGVKALQPHWHGDEVLFFQTEGAALSDSERQSNKLVHLLGQVKNPGDYAVEEKADFFTYLIKAQGPNERADLGNVTLIRTQGDQSSALSFDTQDVASIPQIQPGDTLIFNADNASSLEKKSRLGANFASILSTIGILIIAGQ